MSITPNSVCWSCGGTGECFGRTCDCVTDQISAAAQAGVRQAVRREMEEQLEPLKVKVEKLEAANARLCEDNKHLTANNKRHRAYIHTRELEVARLNRIIGRGKESEGTGDKSTS